MILDRSALAYADLVDMIDVGRDLTLISSPRHRSPMVKQGGREKARGSDALRMSQGVESFAYSSHAQRWILLVTSVVKAKMTIFSVTMNLTSSSRIPVNRYLAVPLLLL